jgi:hypothetical protein
LFRIPFIIRTPPGSPSNQQKAFQAEKTREVVCNRLILLHDCFSGRNQEGKDFKKKPQHIKDASTYRGKIIEVLFF